VCTPTMAKAERLVQKVKRLLRRLKLPRQLHHYGPKIYALWQHLLALVVRAVFGWSYRRTCRILVDLSVEAPTYSALAKMAKRMPSALWQRALAATCSTHVHVAAIDGTFFERNQPSYHYLRRIDRKGPGGIPVKASILVDTRRKKVLAARIRVLPAHDVRDVVALLKHCMPHILVADKGYDSEAVHEHCFEHGITSMIPIKSRTRSGFYRRQQHKKFRLRTYNRRQIVESVFSRIKRLFGSTVRCRRARTIRAELFARFIAHNLTVLLNRHFQLSRLTATRHKFLHS